MSDKYPFADMPDAWAFTPLVTGRPELLVPTDNMGIIYSRERWQAIRDHVDAFFADFDDATIQQENKERYNRLKAEEAERARKVSPPRKNLAGYIYVLRSELGHYKIGKATNPYARSQTLGTEQAVAINLIYTARCTDRTLVEKALHKALSADRMNGEWFNLSQETVDWLLYHDWVDDLNLRAIVTDCERVP